MQYEKIDTCLFQIYTYLGKDKYYLNIYDESLKLFAQDVYFSTYKWQFLSIPDDINERYYYSYPQGKPSTIEITNFHQIAIKDNHVENPTLACIRIYDINGRLMSASSDEIVDISTLSTGFYIIGIDSKEYIKFIKR